MERGDPELEAVLDEKFGRSNLASPSSQVPVPTPRSRVKGRFSGKAPKPLTEIVGDDGIQRRGEFETEEVYLERTGIAPHQLGTPVSEQTHAPTPRTPRPSPKRK